MVEVVLEEKRREIIKERLKSERSKDINNKRKKIVYNSTGH